MNKALAQNLLLKFNIVERVDSVQVVSGGRQHQVFKVSLSNARSFVIKHLNMQCYLGRYTREHFDETEKFSAYVSQQLDCSLSALAVDDFFTIVEQGNAYLIYPWSEGISFNKVNRAQCSILGGLMAKLHNISSFNSLFTLKSSLLLNLDSWPQALKNYLSNIEIQALVSLAKLCMACCADDKGTKVYSHRDLNLGNILWLDNDRPLLIDWESAGYIVPEVELLGMAFNLAGIASGELVMPLVIETIKAYKLSRPQVTIFSQAHYLQSYATWFYWLDYCFSTQTLTSDEVECEIKTTLHALQLLEAHKFEILALA